MDKEQIEQKAEKHADDYATPDLDSSFRAYIYEANKEGYIAGAKENGIQWHDLRKNPLDLPTKNCMVLIYTDWQGIELKTFFVDTRLFGNLTFREVIAWAEIPEFKEVEL